MTSLEVCREDGLRGERCAGDSGNQAEIRDEPVVRTEHRGADRITRDQSVAGLERSLGRGLLLAEVTVPVEHGAAGLAFHN